MKKISLLILFFALCLSLFSFRVYSEPLWSGNTSTTPINYSANVYSEFNVTWSNNINMTFITIKNSTGYVFVNNSSMSNLTYGGDIYNFSVILSAGTFNWVSYANDSANNWNSTNTWTFTISKADNPVHLYLNTDYDNQNKTYIYPESINVTSTSTVGNVFLYRNENPVSNPEIILFGNGTYTYKANATGNQNYSDNVTGVTYYVFVNKGSTSNILNLLLNDSASNLTIVLPSNISINASEIATGDNDTNYTLWVNGTELIKGTFGNGNVSNTSFSSIGIYIYTYNTSGGENWTSGSKSLTLFVTNINYTSISVTPLNQSNYQMGTSYNFSINVSGNISKVYFVANFNNSFVEYSINSINVTNWNKTIIVYNNSGVFWVNFTDFKTSDFYYWWAIQDINNIWVNTSNTTYTVNRTPTIPSLSSDSGWEVITSSTASVLITCSATAADTYLLLYGGCSNTSFGSVRCSVYPTSNVTYFCEASGNYTGIYNRTLVATSSSTTPPITTPSGSFTVTPSSSSITLEPNSSGTITLTLKNTYSYNFTKINITVSGINASWYSLSKVNISVLQKNGSTDTSILTLNIPGDAERKNYTIIASAVGKDPSGYRLTRQTSIKLIIPEIPQNVTNETNETESFNNTDIGNQTNQTNVTGFSINLEEFKDYIVLLIALVSIVLIFIFRNEFTGFIRGKKPEVQPEHKTHEEPIHKEPKKIHRILSHVKKKISSLSEHRLVIQVKKKEKEKEEKA